MIEQSPLVLGAGELWPEATSGEFLSAICDGNLPSEAFQRWLVQDYSFAKGLAAIQAVAVAKTPRPAQKVLIAGPSALDVELDWFEQNADGKLRNCLFALDELDVKAVMRSGGSDDEIIQLICRSVHNKWEGHEINTARFVQPLRPMYAIGR